MTSAFLSTNQLVEFLRYSEVDCICHYFQSGRLSGERKHFKTPHKPLNLPFLFTLATRQFHNPMMNDNLHPPPHRRGSPPVVKYPSSPPSLSPLYASVEPPRHPDYQLPLFPSPSFNTRGFNVPSFAAPSVNNNDHCSNHVPSSDSAIFSSDDGGASTVENYASSSTAATTTTTGSKRKRRYRGTWWGKAEKIKDAKKKRAGFKEKQFVDSGVWLPSDGSVSIGASSTAFPSEDDDGKGEEDSATFSQVRTVFRLVREPEEHELARAVVADCLDRGQDSIDLR